MKRKLLTMLLAIACISCLSFGAAACADKEDEHVHDWGEWIETTPAGCESEGEEIRTCKTDSTHTEKRNTDPTGHDLAYSYDDTYHYKKCNSCTETTEKAEHEYNQLGICEICDYEIPETEGLEITVDDGGLCWVNGIGSVTATKIRIPAEFNGKPVTFIGSHAFENCTSLVSVIIPDSVTVINYGAFRGCTSLVSITTPDSVTEIGGGAFSYCTGLKSVTIGNGVTSISDGVFWGCTSLESIVVSSGNKVYHSDGNCLIETASKTLIAGCKNSKIPFDGSVTGIGESAFRDCTSLVSITIPDNVTSIGYGAFNNCTSLNSVTISNSVTSIGVFAFMNCTSLVSITIPDSVTSIDGYAFSGCTSLESVIFENTTGWGTFTTSIASSDLADPATAAKHLTNTYCSSDWKRS